VSNKRYVYLTPKSRGTRWPRVESHLGEMIYPYRKEKNETMLVRKKPRTSAKFILQLIYESFEIHLLLLPSRVGADVTDASQRM
jgi:hypothetical protein